MRHNTLRTPANHSLLLGLNSLYSYIFCLLVSNLLTRMPIFGGALYMCTRVAADYVSTCMGPGAALLPEKFRKNRRLILIFLLILNLFLVVIYPLQLSSFQLWTVTLIVIAMLVRDQVSQRLIKQRAYGRLGRRGIVTLMAIVHIVPALLVLWDLHYNLLWTSAWLVFAAYVLQDVLVLYIQVMEGDAMVRQLQGNEVEASARLQEVMSHVNAFRVYAALSFTVIVAAVMTMALIYTTLIMTAELLFQQMVIALGVSLLSLEAAEWIKRYRERKHRADPTNMMIFGIFLWFYGLNTFRTLMPIHPDQMLSFYTCLGLCTAGCSLCLVCLGRMEEGIMAVARLKAGEEFRGFELLRSYWMELYIILGEMAALIMLTILCYINGQDLPSSVMEALSGMQPLMVVPVLIMVIAALVFTFRFPLSKRSMEKLDWLLHIRNEGGSNPALEKQLEGVAVKTHRQPFGTTIMKFVIRKMYRHKLCGTENLRVDDENPLIFLCNHGDIYGPVVCACYIPVPIRPWVISNLCLDPEEVAVYHYKYDLAENKWIPPFLKMPVARIVGRISVWGMRQLEAIPVFRDQPGQLMRTFRASVEALQSGDNLLIFPENPNAISKDHGYEMEGLGPMFEGFSLLASIYYKRTGKACRFMPMYAYKKGRTLCFGHEVDYNPLAEDEAAERHRVVQECEKEMLRLYEEQSALLSQHK